MNETKILNVTKIAQQVLAIQKAAEGENPLPEITGNGVALLRNYSTGVTSSGKPKYTGAIANQDEVRFSVWNNSKAFDTLASLPAGTTDMVVEITYTISKFGLVLSQISPVEGYSAEDFIFRKYDLSKLSKEFCDTVTECGATDTAKNIIKKVLHMRAKDEISRRFGREYAALSHHDNCPSGLLAHTRKCLVIYAGLRKSYSFLSDERINDLMIISITLHDVGKIFEMHNGVYQDSSFLTHRALGYRHLLQYEEVITSAYGREFFDMVCSVLLQHHGEYGETPRTAYAMLVNMIDEMDATFTSVDEMLEMDLTTTDAAGRKIRFNDAYFNVLRTN